MFQSWVETGWADCFQLLERMGAEERDFLGVVWKLASCCGHPSKLRALILSMLTMAEHLRGLDSQILSLWWAIREAGLSVLSTGFGLVGKFWKLRFYWELFHVCCLPSLLPTLILGMGRGLEGSMSGCLGSHSPLVFHRRASEADSEAPWDWWKLTASPVVSAVVCSTPEFGTDLEAHLWGW